MRNRQGGLGRKAAADRDDRKSHPAIRPQRCDETAHGVPGSGTEWMAPRLGGMLPLPGKHALAFSLPDRMLAWMGQHGTLLRATCSTLPARGADGRSCCPQLPARRRALKCLLPIPNQHKRRPEMGVSVGEIG